VPWSRLGPGALLVATKVTFSDDIGTDDAEDVADERH
jgi:hypothetical protein